MSSDEALCALALSRLPGVGAASFRALIERHGAPSRALDAWRPPGRGARRPKAATLAGLDRGRRWVEGGGALLYLGGPGYPQKLLALGEPPPVLFVRGQPSALALPAVAVVGGRDADAEARAVAGEVAAHAAGLGLAVVSGGARGIDGAAHQGALAAGGASVVVLGCGVDVDYPPEHAGLFAGCERRGAVVSELLPGAPPARSFFVTRNRIVAALSLGVLLVRGRSDSGALVTAAWAQKLGRPAAAVRWSGGDASGVAIARGATPLAGREEARAWVARLGQPPEQVT